MAFDRLVTFHAPSGHPLYYPPSGGTVPLSTFQAWGEFVIYPVLANVLNTGLQRGTVVIRCPYSPILTQAFARDNRGRPANTTWVKITVDDIIYEIDNIEIREGYRFVEVSGVNGESTLLP